MIRTLLMLLIVSVVGVDAADGQNSLYAVFDMDDRHVSKNHLFRSLTATIGDSSAENFNPVLEISAWGKECSFTIDLVPAGYESIISASRSVFDNKTRVDCTAGDSTLISLYQLDDGSLEWLIRFDTAPKSNTLEFSFDSQNLRFFYQDSAFFTDDVNVSGPDWAQGSYAVYHTNRRHNYKNIHGNDTLIQNYATGKAFHIRRPVIYNSRGESAWCRINIDTLAGLMTLEIPDDFLKGAAYPIIIDPTFGKTSVGAWSLTIVNYRHTVLWNIGQAETGQGEITKGYIYCEVMGDLEGALQVKVHSYSKGNDLGGSKFHSSSAASDITETSAHWQECPMSGQLQTGTTYITSLQAYNAINNKLRVYADATGWGDVKYYDPADWNVPDSLSGYSSKNDGFSTYIEYTVETGETRPLIRRRKLLSGDDKTGHENKNMNHFNEIKEVQICEK